MVPLNLCTVNASRPVGYSGPPSFRNRSAAVYVVLVIIFNKPRGVMPSHLPITLLTGVDAPSRGTVATTLLDTARLATAVLVEYDVSGLAGGSVLRIARTTSGVIDREVIRMDHPCVSCAMRSSLVPLLVSIAATGKYAWVIVSVPGAGDTQALAKEIARDAGDDLRVSSVLTVLDTATFTEDVTSEDLIHDRGIPTATEDGRAIAEVLVRQVEYANAVILHADESEGAKAQVARALTEALNPQALVRTTETAAELSGVRLHDPGAAETWVEPGSISAPLQSEGRVETLVWQSTRPFHPERLYDALEDLVAGDGSGQGDRLARLAATRAARLGQLRHEHRARRPGSVARGPAGGALVRGRADAPGPFGARVAPRTRRPGVVPVHHRDRSGRPGISAAARWLCPSCG